MKISKNIVAFLLVLVLSLMIVPGIVAAEGDETQPSQETAAPSETTESTGASNPTDTQPTETEPTGTQPTETEPTETESTETEPTDTEPTETESTETDPTTQPTQPVWRPQPTTEPKVNTDYADLNRQIAIANGLKEREYTQESWKVLTAALETARNAQKSDKQDVVDSAAEALKQAISELVTMDYSELEKALTAAKECVGPEEYELVIALHEAVVEAELLRNSGDQDAVDACTDKIYDLIQKLGECQADVGEPSVIIREVEVEVPPSEDYCNISLHHIWPLLFFASVGLNVALLIVIFSVLRRRKRRGEDVPLVNYDIDDDF